MGARGGAAGAAVSPRGASRLRPSAARAASPPRRRTLAEPDPATGLRIRGGDGSAASAHTERQAHHLPLTAERGTGRGRRGALRPVSP